MMTSESRPLFSIIMAVRNSESCIESTLATILNQSFQNFELIIIDGCSSDSTMSILSKYRKNIGVLISEPDDGISDAFNKGISLSRGQYINFQGDSDGFVDNNALLNCSSLLNQHNYPLMLSTRVYNVDFNKTILNASPRINSFIFPFRLLYSMCIPHQGLFTSRQYFDRFGPFSLEFKYSMDYEHLLRSWHFPVSISFSDYISAFWSVGGIGANCFDAVLKEYVLCKTKNIKYPGFLFYWIYYLQIFLSRVKSFYFSRRF